MSILKMLHQAAFDTVVNCPYCDTEMEADCPECPECGKPNPLVEFGMI